MAKWSRVRSSIAVEDEAVRTPPPTRRRRSPRGAATDWRRRPPSRSASAAHFTMTAGAGSHRHVLLVGDGELAIAIAATVVEGGGTVERLTAPNDIELREAIERGVSAVAVIDRDDIAALRLALVIEHVRPDVPLLVTIFDRTVAEQLHRVAPNCHVMSLADVTVPALVGPCVSEELLALWSHGESPAGIVASPQGPVAVPAGQYRAGGLRHALRVLGNQLRPPDRGAWLLLLGVGGLGRDPAGRHAARLDRARQRHRAVVLRRHEHGHDTRPGPPDRHAARLGSGPQRAHAADELRAHRDVHRRPRRPHARARAWPGSSACGHCRGATT